MSSYPSSRFHTAYIGTHHALQTGSSNFSIGLSQGKSDRRGRVAHQLDYSADRWQCAMFCSTPEPVAVVEAQSLRCFRRVQGRGTCSSSGQNLC
jgi:hypothetical protein